MRMRRRFQPIIDGLPYRIVPSTAADMIPGDMAAPPASVTPVMMPCDADPPQTGIWINDYPGAAADNRRWYTCRADY